MSKREQRIRLAIGVINNLKIPLGSNDDGSEMTYLREDIESVLESLYKILALDRVFPMDANQKVGEAVIDD